MGRDEGYKILVTGLCFSKIAIYFVPLVISRKLIYVFHLYALMLSIRNLRLPKHTSVADW